jgi:hypothetical protein
MMNAKAIEAMMIERMSVFAPDLGEGDDCFTRLRLSPPDPLPCAVSALPNRSQMFPPLRCVVLPLGRGPRILRQIPIVQRIG